MKVTSVILTLVVIIALTMQMILLQNGDSMFVGAQNSTIPDVFTVIPAIYGVSRDTNEVVLIVSTGNWTMTRVVNASLSDLVDNRHDGIIEITVRFANKTVPTAQEFKACVITASNLNTICKTGHNSPSTRPETIDLVLTNGNSSTRYTRPGQVGQ